MLRLIQFDPRKPTEYEFRWDLNEEAEAVLDRGWEYVGMVQHGGTPSRTDLAAASKCFREALSLQPDLIDAYAGLGLVETHRDRWEAAKKHYARGFSLGERLFPPTWLGTFSWAVIWNRPFFRCLHGLGLAHQRLGELDTAAALFRWAYSLNPNDNMGFRYLLGEPRPASMEPITFD